MRYVLVSRLSRCYDVLCEVEAAWIWLAEVRRLMRDMANHGSQTTFYIPYLYGSFGRKLAENDELTYCAEFDDRID
ncbi:MAG: hypothetical protein KatS3mg020_0208 [Fimbriimonadales bacterium]|nr:MAG: hypothetical protein KatS3mg020_0208 [Fimbriimonadales bacterium]